jgi:hypothetical protein
VRCVESKTNVYASHCNCSSFARHQHCTHIEVVTRYYARFYKPAAVAVQAPVKVEAPKVVKVRKPRNGLVRKQRNGGLVKVERPVQTAKVTELPVRPVAKVVEQPVAKITDISTLGNFGTKAFSILR